MEKDTYNVKGYEVSDYKLPELTDEQRIETLKLALGSKEPKVHRIGMCSSFGTIGVGSTTFALAEAMHHSRDHNVIIVGPPPVPVEEQILIKNFKEYMTEMWVINRFYEGETIPRLLIKIGLSTWYKLEAEYLLIKNKQSKHNRHTRTCIEKAYNIIVKKV